MAATVLGSSAFVLSLLVCPVFCFSNMISFTREDLLKILQNTSQNILPDFDYSYVLLDIVFGGAATLFRRYSTRRLGKRAGALVKLRQRGLRTPLPSIHLANLRSLPNKTDKFLLLSRTNKDFSNCCSVFHGNLAERRHTGQCIKTALFSADQIRPRRRINREIVRRRDVLLHQWEVVYRCNWVKGDVQFWSGNSLL